MICSGPVSLGNILFLSEKSPVPAGTRPFHAEKHRDPAGSRSFCSRVLTVPDGTTQLSVPASDSKGFDNSEIYRPTGQVVDGLEVWERVQDPWTDTGAMPLA